MPRQIATTPARQDGHLLEIFLPFYILFSQYSIGPLSIGSLLLFLIGILLIVKKSGKIMFPTYYQPFLVFLIYAVLRDLFRAMLGSDAVQTQINRMIEYLLVYFFVFVVCTQDFSEDKLYKAWKIAGVIFTAGLVFQLIQNYLLGQRIAPISIIPGYQLRPDDGALQNRPSSFFAEPASFVNAMIPLEFIALRRKDIIWAVFSAVAILLSASTVGVILSIVLWAASIVQRGSSVKKRVLTVFVAAVITILFVNLEIFNSSFAKFMEVTSGESTFGSRVLTGLEIVQRQSALELVLGTNYNNVSAFVSAHLSDFSGSAVVLTYWRSGRLFLNTFSRLIFQYGIVGLLLFLAPLVKYLRQKDYKAKMLIIMTVVAIFGQTMLLNTYYFMLMILFLLYEKDSLFEPKEPTAT